MKNLFLQSISLVTLAMNIAACGDLSDRSLDPNGNTFLNSTQNLNGEWQLVSMNDQPILEDDSVALSFSESTCDGAVHADVNNDGSLSFLSIPSGCFVDKISSAAAYHQAVASAVKSGAIADIKDIVPYGDSLVIHHDSSVFVFTRKP